MMRFWIILLIIASVPYESLAATVQINCSSPSTVQSAINSAGSGDTVQCNASGSYTWNSAVALPSSKYITLDMNGASVTMSGSNGEITLYAHPTGSNRITNGRIIRGSGYSTLYAGPFLINNSNLNYGTIIIDNITFSGSNVVIEVNGIGPALIHSCTFPSISAGQEFIHITPWGPGSTAGWTNALVPGNINAIYLEDNDVTGAVWNSSNFFQTYYGGRVVARYNHILGDGAKLDVHGNVEYSGRWWEFYKNTFTGDADLCLRGGSGIIFGNTGNGATFFTEENNSGTDQVGRGQNFASYPAYAWDNDRIGYNFNQTGCAPPAGNIIKKDVDVYTNISQGTSLPGTCSTGQGYWKTDEGGNWDTTNGTSNDGRLYKCTSTDTWTAYYTPLEYPHPARGESSDGGNTPMPPQNLRIMNSN